MASSFNLFIYITGIVKYTLGILLNSIVIHIISKRFGISQVDMLIIFLLCIVDILFCIQNYIHLIWHWSSESQISSNPVYCKVYFGLYWIIASFGYNLLVALSIVRYFAICRKLVLSRWVAILKPAFCSIISFSLGVCMAIYADPKENQGLTYCSLNTEANYVSSPIELFLTIMTFFYLLLMSYSYYHISIYYYNTIQLMEINAKALSKIIQAEFNTNVRGNWNERQVQDKLSINSNTRNNKVKSDNRNISTSEIKSVNNTTVNTCKVKCLAYRLISLIKVQSMIVIFFIEMLPITVLHFLNHFTKIPHYLKIEVMFYYLAEFIPITNPAMILFLHEETYQEFKFLCLLIKLRLKRMYLGSG